MHGVLGGHEGRGGAGGVGAVALDDAAVDVLLASLLGVGAEALRVLHAAAMRAGMGVGREEHLDLGVGEDDGADVAALGHHVGAAGELALELDHGGAHGRNARHRAHGSIDARRADLARHVAPRDQHALTAVGGGNEGKLDRLGDGGQGDLVGEGDIALKGEQGDAAIHRACVEVDEPPALRNSLGNRRLARSSRAVDCNLHV